MNYKNILKLFDVFFLNLYNYNLFIVI